MSYPEPRYDGQTGLVNATLRPADRDPDLTFTSGTMAHFLAGGALTDGKFGLYRWELAAASGGATPHFHRTIAESFYVLTGTPRLFDGARWTDGRPGDFLFVPEGGIHGFSNEAWRSAGCRRVPEPPPRQRRRPSGRRAPVRPPVGPGPHGRANGEGRTGDRSSPSTVRGRLRGPAARRDQLDTSGLFAPSGQFDPGVARVLDQRFDRVVA